MVTGASGTGRSHLLHATAEILSPASGILLPGVEQDWRRALELVERSNECVVFADDLDGYDGRFLKEFLATIARNKHRLLATASLFEGRFKRLLESVLPDTTHLRLDPLEVRQDDIQDFIRLWIRKGALQVPDGVQYRETAELLNAMNLEGGFHDLGSILTKVQEDCARVWDPPVAAAWVRAYASVLSPSVTIPAILVEGVTDVIYLRWAASLCAPASHSEDLEITACQSATKIVMKAFEHRNEGRRVVALFDADKIGRERNKELKEHEIPSFALPEKMFPLGQAASSHVVVEVEIEDLIPASVLERFYRETARRPELRIDAPREGRMRIVVHAEDKLMLAEWVRDNIGAEAAVSILEIYNLLRGALGLPSASFA
jgi:hypothetical protein